MKRFRYCLRHDIRIGIRREWKFFLPLLVLTLIFCMDFANKSRPGGLYVQFKQNAELAAMEEEQESGEELQKSDEEELSRSFLDYLMVAFGGMRAYTPSRDEPFAFPTIWVLLIGYLAFLTLRYPLDGLETYGTQVISRVGNRDLWWLSKCVWVVQKTALAYLLVLAVLLGFSQAAGADLTGWPNAFYLDVIYDIDAYEAIYTGQDAVVFLVSPLILAVSLNLVQLFVGMVTQPIAAFAVILGIMVSSAYFCSPLLYASGGMLVRCPLYSENGVPFGQFAVIAAVFALGSVTAGLVVCRRKDIMKKKEE